MPTFNQCTACFRSFPDVTIVDCPEPEAHGPGLSGRCEECLRKVWLENRKPYNINGERSAAIEKQRYYNNVEVACQFCLHSSGTIRRLSGACADAPTTITRPAPDGPTTRTTWAPAPRPAPRPSSGTSAAASTTSTTGPANR